MRLKLILSTLPALACAFAACLSTAVPTLALAQSPVTQGDESTTATDTDTDAPDVEVPRDALSQWEARITLFEQQVGVAGDLPRSTREEIGEGVLVLERLLDEGLNLLAQSRALRVERARQREIAAVVADQAAELFAMQLALVEHLARHGQYDAAVALLDRLLVGDIGESKGLLTRDDLDLWHAAPAVDDAAALRDRLVGEAATWAAMSVSERACELDLRKAEAAWADAIAAVDAADDDDTRDTTRWQALSAAAMVVQVRTRYADVREESTACAERCRSAYEAAGEWWFQALADDLSNIEERAQADDWRRTAAWYLSHWSPRDETASAVVRDRATSIERHHQGLLEDFYSMAATERVFAIGIENRDVQAAYRILWQADLSNRLGEFDGEHDRERFDAFLPDAAQQLAALLASLTPTEPADEGEAEAAGDGNDHGEGEGEGESADETDDMPRTFTANEIAGLARLYLLHFPAADAAYRDAAAAVTPLTTASGVNETESFVAMAALLLEQTRTADGRPNPTPAWAWERVWDTFMALWTHYRQQRMQVDPENPPPLYQRLVDLVNVLVADCTLDSEGCPSVEDDEPRALAWARLTVERLDVMLTQMFTATHPQKAVRALMLQHRERLQAVLDEAGGTDDNSDG